MELATLLNVLSTLALVGASIFAGLQVRSGNRVRSGNAPEAAFIAHADWR